MLRYSPALLHHEGVPATSSSPDREPNRTGRLLKADRQLDDDHADIGALAEGAIPLRAIPGGAPAHGGGALTRLAIRETGRTYFIPVDAIDWIEGADYYVKLHVSGRVHLLREPLRSLAQRLDPSRFARVHRSAIVNLARVREIRVAAKGDHAIVLDDTTRLRLTRTRRRDLEALIECAPTE
jgi:two-component system LytT family response regulator